VDYSFKLNVTFLWLLVFCCRWVFLRIYDLLKLSRHDFIRPVNSAFNSTQGSQLEQQQRWIRSLLYSSHFVLLRASYYYATILLFRDLVDDPLNVTLNACWVLVIYFVSTSVLEKPRDVIDAMAESEQGNGNEPLDLDQLSEDERAKVLRDRERSYYWMSKFMWLCSWYYQLKDA
jgi:hypothetical protein